MQWQSRMPPNGSSSWARFRLHQIHASWRLEPLQLSRRLWRRPDTWLAVPCEQHREDATHLRSPSPARVGTTRPGSQRNLSEHHPTAACDLLQDRCPPWATSVVKTAAVCYDVAQADFQGQRMDEALLGHHLLPAERPSRAAPSNVHTGGSGVSSQIHRQHQPLDPTISARAFCRRHPPLPLPRLAVRAWTLTSRQERDNDFPRRAMAHRAAATSGGVRMAVDPQRPWNSRRL